MRNVRWLLSGLLMLALLVVAGQAAAEPIERVDAKHVCMVNNTAFDKDQIAVQVDGKRKAVYARTRQEVVAKLDALRRDVARAGLLPDPGRRTLNDLLDAWLAVKAPGLKPRTLADYRDTCDRYLRPTLGAVRLDRSSALAISLP